jgi:hypothetical protein
LLTAAYTSISEIELQMARSHVDCSHCPALRFRAETPGACLLLWFPK